MKNRWFYLILAAITLGGLILRTVDYDRLPPFGETFDEFHYAWAGLTWITTGKPTSWSWLSAYPKSTKFNRWGQSAPLVSPMIEKPPLFIISSGAWVFLNGARDIFDVRLATLRILPLILSVVTIFCTGLLAKKVFSEKVGLIAVLLYTSVPFIVLSNRFALTENMLTPIVLVTLLATIGDPPKFSKNLFQPLILGFGAGLAILTKQSGIALWLTLIVIYLLKKQGKSLLLMSVITLGLAVIYPLIGYFYDWQLFLRIAQEFRQTFALSGLPEFIFSVFRLPIVSCKDCTFLDGTMLTGYIVLFTAPWWFKLQAEREKFSLLLGFPLVYLLVNSLLLSGSGLYFYGWYLYPLFPFLMILVANILYFLWRHFSFSQTLILTLILGSSSLRFLLQFIPQSYRYLWQIALCLTFIGILIIGLVPWKKIRQSVLLSYFILYILINIYTVIHLAQIYPVLSQPLN